MAALIHWATARSISSNGSSRAKSSPPRTAPSGFSNAQWISWSGAHSAPSSASASGRSARADTTTGCPGDSEKCTAARASHCTYGASGATSARPDTASMDTCERRSYCQITAWSKRRTLKPSLTATKASSRSDLHACSFRWYSSSSAAMFVRLFSVAGSVTAWGDQETRPYRPCREAVPGWSLRTAPRVPATGSRLRPAH